LRGSSGGDFSSSAYSHNSHLGHIFLEEASDGGVEMGKLAIETSQGRPLAVFLCRVQIPRLSVGKRTGPGSLVLVHFVYAFLADSEECSMNMEVKRMRCEALSMELSQHSEKVSFSLFM
jgi:hypothetical protein